MAAARAPPNAVPLSAATAPAAAAPRPADAHDALKKGAALFFLFVLVTSPVTFRSFFPASCAGRPAGTVLQGVLLVLLFALLSALIDRGWL